MVDLSDSHARTSWFTCFGLLCGLTSCVLELIKLSLRACVQLSNVVNITVARDWCLRQRTVFDADLHNMSQSSRVNNAQCCTVCVSLLRLITAATFHRSA